VTSTGRAFQTRFQTRAPATEKARRPTVGSVTAGTHRSSEVEDRSLCRVGRTIGATMATKTSKIRLQNSTSSSAEHHCLIHNQRRVLQYEICNERNVENRTNQHKAGANKNTTGSYIRSATVLYIINCWGWERFTVFHSFWCVYACMYTKRTLFTMK